MKTKTWPIKVGPKNITELRDPQGKGHDTYYGYVKVSDLPWDLPTEVNPRAQNLQSRVARAIGQGLIDEGNVFHLLNRGLTITAHDANYDSKKGVLNVELANGHYGLLDGGHTYAVIRKNVMPYLEPAKEGEEELIKPDYLNSYVRVEVIVGIKSDLLVEIAQARNTSAQVHDESLANLEGSFDWLKDILAKTKFGQLVSYKENESDEKFPIDVREIVALLTLFHPKFEDPENPPIMGYTSKGRCLQLFREEPEGFQNLKFIIPDILDLYDYEHLRFPEYYKAVGGFGSMGDDKPTKSTKLAKVTEVKRIEEGFPLYYANDKAFYKFPDGYLLPAVAAMRGIVNYKNLARWKAPPRQFFDKVGRSLVKATLETSISTGRNPNAVGKMRPHWSQLHERVLNTYLKLAGADPDKEIVLEREKELAA